MRRRPRLLQSAFSVVLTCHMAALAGCVGAPPTQPDERIDSSGPMRPPLVVNPVLRTPDNPITDTPSVTVSGTSSGTQPGTAAPLGEEVALRAIALVGKPYRYGGADLEGFDCSGLVYFIHQALGFTVPRTAAQQQQTAARVRKNELQPGDLLFFRTTSSKRITHVAVYVGENRFVHAPQSGKLIELRTLDDRYYGPRLVSLGRLHPTS